MRGQPGGRPRIGRLEGGGERHGGEEHYRDDRENSR